MFTNDLRKGDMVMLRNGWRARIEDNKKGNTRLATVYGTFTEMGSVYAHDIKYKFEDAGETIAIELTPAQEKLRQTVSRL
jgi:hypothetical protein